MNTIIPSTNDNNPELKLNYKPKLGPELYSESESKSKSNLESESELESETNAELEPKLESYLTNYAFDSDYDFTCKTTLSSFTKKQKRMHCDIIDRFCDSRVKSDDINEINIDKIYDLLFNDVILEEDDMIYNYFVGAYYYFEPKDNIIKAIEYFKKSSKYNYVNAYLMLAECYKYLKKSEKVIKNYLIAIECNEEYLESYYNLGLYYLSIDEPENAKKYFIIGADKGDTDCPLQLCRIYEKEENIDFFQKYYSMYEFNKIISTD